MYQRMTQTNNAIEFFHNFVGQRVESVGYLHNN